jgi:phage tail-like protein
VPQFDPLLNFRFIVEISGPGAPMAAAFTQFSGVQMQVETVKVRSGADPRGVMDYFPALTQFGNITLRKGVIGEQEFLDWIFAAAPEAESAATGVDLYRDIDVVALDDVGNRVVTWTLHHALPVAYKLEGMDAAQSAVLCETLTFQINGFTRVYRDPPQTGSTTK